MSREWRPSNAKEQYYDPDYPKFQEKENNWTQHQWNNTITNYTFTLEKRSMILKWEFVTRIEFLQKILKKEKINKKHSKKKPKKYKTMKKFKILTKIIQKLKNSKKIWKKGKLTNFHQVIDHLE